MNIEISININNLRVATNPYNMPESYGELRVVTRIKELVKYQ